MQVFADGKCRSSAGRIVTEGIGWKPSSEAGRAGDPVQKKTKSCFSIGDIFSTIDQSHLKFELKLNKISNHTSSRYLDQTIQLS